MSEHNCSDYPNAWPCSAVNAARDPELAEREAIEADARNERDGYGYGRDS